ncbi:MAG TPA: saccharopine dehydrogenase NADP-binding domain-containing protein [Myxococcaceae bacterium]|nr:saccharopine dehydrogenase NADP-binding domain-containing protein [Myxococcaceae bacterium]
MPATQHVGCDMTRSMTTRPIDVLLYGAGGFTGRLTVAELSRHAPPGLRWALAGRHRGKLEAARDAADGPGRPAEILEADSARPETVDAAVSRARVVLTTAGPFAAYGNPVVDACVRHRAHYVDITGETPWVADVIDRHHAQASADGTRIIPFCGFDSVPSDLGALLVVEHLRSRGTGCAEVLAAFRLRGGLNGGTAATAVQLFESGQARRSGHPFLLDGAGRPRLSREEFLRERDPKGVRWNPDLRRWLAPFVMAMVNTRVVRRSARLAAEAGTPYGSHFAYREFMAMRSRTRATVLAVGLAGAQLALASPLRPLLKRMLPAPGTGPSDEVQRSGWFRVDLVGTGEDGRRAFGLVKDQGDPGNTVTVKCLCEAALALAVDGARLPGGPTRGGVLTPATGLGQVLVERLRARGMTLAAADAPIDGSPGG